MFLHVTLVLLALLSLLSSCSNSRHKGSCWYKATINDLNFIKGTLQENSAFAANKQDKSVQEWLRVEKHKTNLKALEVKNQTSYISTLKYYLDGFGIDHLSIRMLKEASSERAVQNGEGQ